MLSTSTLMAQTHSLSGKIINNETKRPISGATVYLEEARLTALSDTNGYYTFSHLPASAYTLVVFSVGTQTIKQKISLNVGENTLNFNLEALSGSLSDR
ncbi:MAG: carboxypeptidase-like regulatory domain-containing protein, partial [Bacteroidia bacterium]|nr:carboxypeptidase-like regulatory domain-containing protein [Bacteroidia bacterium]